MKTKEQSYFVNVKKTSYVTYYVVANSFEEALSSWEEFGEAEDVDTQDDIVVGIVLQEKEND